MTRTEPNPEERAFLDAYDPAAFDRPSVSVDVVMLTLVERELRALLVRRREHPFRDAWALPGTFVQMDEPVDAAAARALRTKTALDGVFLEQLYTFGEPTRDPRTRVITVAYYALVDWDRVQGRLDATEGTALAPVVVPWAGETGSAVELTDTAGETLPLAFDHADIVGMAIKRIRGKLDYAPIGFQLLPERFTLLQLQEVHETVLGQEIDKNSFRRRMLATGLLEATGQRQRNVGHRPAELYRFIRRSAV